MLSLVGFTSFGLESVLRHELTSLGYGVDSVETGRVFFQGEAEDLCFLSMALRTAEHLSLLVGSFPASEFDAFFDGIYAIPWPDFLREEGRFVVNVSLNNGDINSEKESQAIAKKAIIKKLQTRWPQDRFPESGAPFFIDISLDGNNVSVFLNASGEGLHKRGYRQEAGPAPLRETVAASLVMLSRWRAGEAFCDPFCGSGTIAIEAALIAAKKAPGINRSFAAQDWPFIERELWNSARKRLIDAEDPNDTTPIMACDIDSNLLEITRRNAERAGVLNKIVIQKKDARSLQPLTERGTLVTNPPWGERMDDPSIAIKLMEKFGENLEYWPRWHKIIVSGLDNFESYFGRSSTRNRKIYNGNIKCYAWFYLPERPNSDPRKQSKSSESQGTKNEVKWQKPMRPFQEKNSEYGACSAQQSRDNRPNPRNNARKQRPQEACNNRTDKGLSAEKPSRARTDSDGDAT